MSDVGLAAKCATSGGPTSNSLITELDLARARGDPNFRRQLAADHLELLLRELNRLRGEAPDAGRARQLREGAQLAVRLAALLQRIAAAGPSGAPQP
jgi:hypothetical protein